MILWKLVSDRRNLRIFSNLLFVAIVYLEEPGQNSCTVDVID